LNDDGSTGDRFEQDPFEPDLFEQEPFDQEGFRGDPYRDEPDPSRSADIGPEVDAESLIQRAIDVISSARRAPLSASVLVARDEVLDLLQGAVDRMPDELRQARWLLREREEFLSQRQRDADELVEEVRAQAQRMVQRTEIVRHANQTAQRIVIEARDEARRLRHEAEDYCDQRLANFEIVLDRTMKTVQAGRERLASTPTPVSQGPGSGSARGLGAGDDDADVGSDSGFFDQDLP
jgi:hypothetical protein